MIPIIANRCTRNRPVTGALGDREEPNRRVLIEKPLFAPAGHPSLPFGAVRRIGTSTVSTARRIQRPNAERRGIARPDPQPDTDPNTAPEPQIQTTFSFRCDRPMTILAPTQEPNRLFSAQKPVS